MAEQPDRIAEDFSRRIENWEDLAKTIDHFSYFNGHAWLFRGVTKLSHGLVPKIGRPNARAKKTVSGTKRWVRYRLDDERAMFSMFVQQARPFLSFSPVSDLEWLAIAQHHGVPTRLLDWTESLMVAAWFAVEKGGSEEDSAIWVSRGI